MRSVDVVPRKEYPHYSSTPAKGNEYNSRHRILSNARQDRLEAEPLDIPEDQQSLRSTRSGLVCFQTICPVPTLLQLAARSICTSNRCLHSELGKHEVLCKSPWNLVGRVLTKVQAQQTQLVLVAPVCKTQPWFPTLLHMLIDHPRLIIQEPEAVVSKDPMPLLPQLAVWHI